MAWSKTTTTFKKPIGWWYHKAMCEIAYFFRNKFYGMTWQMYYHHLNEMSGKYRINLYGERF